uniref:Uncharacterized protein n=1 Tax=Romanomermis culicivorax TaxID=13658 RepID=A0A915L9B4_ROMCU
MRQNDAASNFMSSASQNVRFHVVTDQESVRFVDLSAALLPEFFVVRDEICFIESQLLKNMENYNATKVMLQDCRISRFPSLWTTYPANRHCQTTVNKERKHNRPERCRTSKNVEKQRFYHSRQ